MLLKRLALGFRNQDWFAVFVELLVLIMGVFLGLQVDDWNQTRLDRTEEQYYLQRLAQDFERSLEDQGQAIDGARTSFENSLEILKILENGDLGEMTPAEFQERLNGLRGFPPITLVTATIDELVANGKGTLLQSDELRIELARFIDWYNDRERYYDMLSTMIIDAYIQQNRFLKPEFTDSTEYSRPDYSADLNALIDNPDVLTSMRQLTTTLNILWRDLQLLRTQTQGMNDLLHSLTEG